MELFTVIPEWQPVFHGMWSLFMIVVMTLFLVKIVASTVIFLMTDIRSDWNRLWKRKRKEDDKAETLEIPSH